jgi:hypothetical protein
VTKVNGNERTLHRYGRYLKSKTDALRISLGAVEAERAALGQAQRETAAQQQRLLQNTGLNAVPAEALASESAYWHRLETVKHELAARQRAADERAQSLSAELMAAWQEAERLRRWVARREAVEAETMRRRLRREVEELLAARGEMR